MTELWTYISDFPTVLAVGSAAALLAGLALAAFLTKSAARAHASLVAAAFLALAVPLLTHVGQSAGLGMLPAVKPTAVVARESRDPSKLQAAGPQQSANLTNSQAAMVRSDDEASAASLPDNSAPVAATPVHSWLPTAISRLRAPSTLLAVWIALSAIALLRLIVSLARGLRMMARAVPIEDSVVGQRLSRAARRLSLESIPLVFESIDVRSPIIWCWGLRPMLLVAPTNSPPDARSDIARIEWESVFCHELAHWRRRDHLTMLLVELLCCVVPWNPLAWIVRKRVAFLADRACDEHVLAAGCDGPNYADSLLKFVPTADPAFALGAASSRKGLVRRIEAILSRRAFRPHAGRVWLASAATIATCLGLCALLLQPAPARAQAGAPQPSQGTESTDADALVSKLNLQITESQANLRPVRTKIESSGIDPSKLPLTTEQQLIVESDPILRYLRNTVEGIDVQIRTVRLQYGDNHRVVQQLEEQRMGYFEKEVAKREELTQQVRLRQIESLNDERRQRESSVLQLGARLAALTGGDWREASAVGEQLARLPGDEGFELLTAHWPALAPQARQQMLKAWRFATPFPLHDRMHPHLLDVLHLGMMDAAPDVQNWSIDYLRSIAFRDFANDYQQYLAWYDQNRSRPIVDVTRDECRRYLTSLAGASGPQLDELAKLNFGWVFRDVPQLAPVIRDSGLLDTFSRWMSNPSLGTEATLRCMDRILPYAGADESYLRTVVLNAAQNGPSRAIRSTAIRTFANPDYAWAVEPLRQLLVDVYRAGGNDAGLLIWDVAGALGELKDPSVIPTMIAIIADDNTYDTVYGIGYFGLGKLTGVEYDESHNGAWWKNWWSKNSIRYPQFAGSTPLPTIARPAGARVASAQQASGDEDVKDVQSEDVRIGKDDQKRYFLIGFDKKKAVPKDGYKLLVVLPGGDGGADFHPFVKRIWKNGLPDGYLIAQAVAPKWRDDENRIVWPTKQLPDDRMKFSTEEFVQQIINDVYGRAKIDKRGVFALGWSSGGPPVYNLALLKDSPLAGAFVAMSVYKPEQLPERENAKGRAFYLLHSPQDFIKMTFPEAAQKELTAAGAKVKLQTYEGGHGWRGDVFGNIRTGVEWLAAQTAAEKK